jgi:hypothetical protein
VPAQLSCGVVEKPACAADQCPAGPKVRPVRPGASRTPLARQNKDLARWVDGELRLLSPAFVGAATGFSRSSPA